MKILDLYEWATGTMSSFTKPFAENEPLYNQAKVFWRNIESNSLVALLIFIIIGALMAIVYYWPFNDKPGRHYRPRYWWMFLAFTAVLSMVVTFAYECLAVNTPNIYGAVMLEFKLSLANALYSALVYLLFSVLWCSLLPTNAYRIFKI